MARIWDSTPTRYAFPELALTMASAKTTAIAWQRLTSTTCAYERQGPKGRVSLQDQKAMGDFICTYSGEVTATSTDPDKDKKSRFRMQFADRYVIEAQESRSVGKYILTMDARVALMLGYR